MNTTHSPELQAFFEMLIVLLVAMLGGTTAALIVHRLTPKPKRGQVAGYMEFRGSTVWRKEDAAEIASLLIRDGFLVMVREIKRPTPRWAVLYTPAPSSIPADLPEPDGIDPSNPDPLKIFRADPAIYDEASRLRPEHRFDPSGRDMLEMGG